MSTLLELEGLRVGFDTGGTMTPVVRGVDIDVAQGEIVGLVGESGCGKSVSCMAACGLLDENASIHGTVRWKGEEIANAHDAAMSRLRGRAIGMIFQDPMSALNPVQRVGKQIIEVLRLSGQAKSGRRSLRQAAAALLREVGVPEPEKRLDAFPHELSGGLSQRVMMAMMLAGRPELLIADEPTTALDVTVQAQIMALLQRQRDERGMSVILITHDLGVVAEICDRVFVMYCGRVIETGPVSRIFSAPQHPYTRGLLAARPHIDRDETELATVPGVVPQPSDLGSGCDFAPRCDRRTAQCTARAPLLAPRLDRGLCACFHPSDITEGCAL